MTLSAGDPVRIVGLGDRVVVVVDALLEAPVVPPHVRRHHGGGVALALHDLGQRRVLGQDAGRHAGRPVLVERDPGVEELRCQDRRDRRHRAGRRRVGERERHGVLDQLGEIGRGVAVLGAVGVAAERGVVVSQGVDREEQDVPVLLERAPGPACRRRARRLVAARSEKSWPSQFSSIPLSGISVAPG